MLNKGDTQAPSKKIKDQVWREGGKYSGGLIDYFRGQGNVFSYTISLGERISFKECCLVLRTNHSYLHLE